MIKKDMIKGLIFGVLIYFVLSVLLELINVKGIRTKSFIAISIILICLLVNYILSKKKS